MATDKRPRHRGSVPKSSGHGGARKGAGRPKAPGESLSEARRRKETALADLRQMEVRKRAGELVPVDDVGRTGSNLVRAARSRLLAVPSRMRHRLSLTSEQSLAIDEEIRAALMQLAAGDDTGGAA
jgi:phage terminase Nu1 subunit (DNA packaging protein)